MADETHRRCPQLGLFRLAKIPLVVSWYRAGSPRLVLEQRFGLGRGATPEDRLVARAKQLARRKG